MTSTAWVGCGDPTVSTVCTPGHGCRPSSRRSRNTQRLPASRTASMAARPTATWSAWLGGPPVESSRVAQADHDVGSVAADRRGDRAPQRQAVFQYPVGQAEELDVGDPDDRGCGALLGLAYGACLFRGHGVDTGLAACGQAVGDLLALSGPARDGSCGAVFEVIGMGDDGQCSLPVLGDEVELLRCRAHRSLLSWLRVLWQFGHYRGGGQRQMGPPWCARRSARAATRLSGARTRSWRLISGFRLRARTR